MVKVDIVQWSFSCASLKLCHLEQQCTKALLPGKEYTVGKRSELNVPMPVSI